VSYVLAFSRRALEDLRQLPVWLQEETLDQIERIAEDPSRLVRRGRLPTRCLTSSRRAHPKLTTSS
jgi:hypothetical protein